MKPTCRRAWLLGAALVLIAGAAAAWSGSSDETVTTVIIVRHAEKEGEVGDPELSEIGHRRAETLAWVLRDVPLAAVYATELKRTRQTVEPIARRKSLQILPYGPSADGIADRVLNRHAGGVVLLCGHSNTVPALLRSFGTGFAQENLDGFDDLFMVTIRGGGDAAGSVSMQRLHYPAGH